MMTDPIADMLSRIRNAGIAQHAEVACPSSKLKLAVARVLENSGFLSNVHVEARQGRATLCFNLRYDEVDEPMIAGIRRVSRPGRRVYVGSRNVARVRNGLGVAVLSTSRGVLSDEDARSASVGGELLCEVW